MENITTPNIAGSEKAYELRNNNITKNKMKTILVPTDFSKNSNNALEYGIEMNKKINAEIVLFHSYFIPFPVTEVPVALPSDLIIKKAAGESLNNIKEKYQGLFPGMKFRTDYSEGFPEIEVLEEENKIKCDLVVIGMHETGAMKKFFIGSNAVKIMEKSSCPVIAVPDNARMKHLNKIVFAANYGIDDFKNAFDLISFARLFNAEVILLHVTGLENEKAFDYSQLSGFKNQLVQESGYANISIKLFEDKDVYEGLNLYLDEVNADMFSISMRNRSFFKKIFEPSLTKKMLYHTHIPIMIFHTENY
jgi:nucleotide-binding universal stress UspA family protein